jgi:glucose/mannose transport system permease protein
MTAMARGGRRINLSARIAAVPVVLKVLIVTIGFTIWTVVHSFTGSKLLPKLNWVGLDQYVRLWGTTKWWVAIENLAIYGALVMVLTLIIGFVLAALLDQKIRGEGMLRTIFLYPFALSFIVTGLAWQWILNPDLGIQAVVRSLGFESFVFDPLFDPNLVIYGLVVAGLWQGSGLIMCIMLAGLRGIDEDLWKAARVDGIPKWKVYLRIILPMMKPALVTSVVLVGVSIVKMYDLVVAMTGGGPGGASEVPAKYVIDSMFVSQNLGQAFAASTMMLVSVVIILVPWLYMQFQEKRHG